jgi:hypothetical protein
MTNRTPWQDAENQPLVTMYFTMLDAQLDGQRYSKADIIRAYRGEPQNSQPAVDGAPLANRSRGSIEFKLMNASAAHADIINDYIEEHGEPASRDTMHSHGYRALPNYQAALRTAMQVEITRRYMADPFAAGAIIA